MARPGRDITPRLQRHHERTGNLIRSVMQVKRRAHLRTRLADGQLGSQALRVSSADSAA